MLYYAAIPQAYDVAVAVIGDRDYIPVLQHVRRLAKRVAIASIRGSCASEYADAVDRERVKDVDIIWLNDMISEIELKYEPRQLTCQSEFHVGDRRVWTTYRPRKGQPFYCDECRKVFSERQGNDHRKYSGEFMPVQAVSTVASLNGSRLEGMIYEIKDDRRYGFIRADTGHEYFFHLTDLANVNWSDIDVGMDVTFQVVNEPSLDRAGKAIDVQLVQIDPQIT